VGFIGRGGRVWACGPAGEGGGGGAARTSGSDPSPARMRRKEGDDGRDPPVSGCGRRARRWAALGHKPNWAATRREEKRPATGKTGGSAGLGHLGCAKETGRGGKVFYF
jgi:hypothetical protein